LEGFDCGNETLNNWLARRALKNQVAGASRTFVVCENERVLAYYAVASGSVERMLTPKPIARNMPEAIPVLVLGRLAVDIRAQGKRLGAGLLRDALLRALRVSREVGVRAVLVHAISEDARLFYKRYGFTESPVDEMTLMLPLKQIRDTF
jgi:predicted N-acetyltransferase YhbS